MTRQDRGSQEVIIESFISLFRSLLPALLLILALYGFGQGYDPIEPIGPDLFHRSIPLGRSSWLSDWQGFGALADQAAGGILVLRATNQESGRLIRRLEPVSPGSLFRVRGYASSVQLRPGSRPWQRGRVILIYSGRSPRSRWDYPHTAVRLQGNQEWTSFEFLSVAPAFAVSGRLMVLNQGRSGHFKVKELSLVPMQYKRSEGWFDIGWVALWCLVALWYSRHLGLWSRPAGWVILLLTVAIVVGMLIPNQLIKRTHLEATQAVAQQIQRLASQPKDQPNEGLSKESSPTPFFRLSAITQWMTSVKPHPLGHLVLFIAVGYSCALMFLADALQHGFHHVGRNALLRLVIWVTSMAAYAAATELLQVLSRSRSPALDDWWLNMEGAALGAVAFVLTQYLWHMMRHDPSART